MSSATRLTVDGRVHEVVAGPLDPLSTALASLPVAAGSSRPVEPCGVGACGACTVLLDGEAVLACLTPVALAEERQITTVGGLAPEDPVVEAFVATTAFACGSCTPGFVLATHDLCATLEGTLEGSITREAIVAGLVGNLCRCGTYPAIIEAARRALEVTRRE